MATDSASLRYRLGVAVILLLALVLRIGAVNQTVVDNPLRGDARDYYQYALNLQQHRIFSRTPVEAPDLPPADAVRTPGYPLLIAPLVSDPPSYEMNRRITLLQALLDCGTVLLALALFRRFLTPGWALGATLLTACSPHLISMTTYLLTETLFTFLQMLALWLLVSAQRRGNRALALAAGSVLAAAALTRPALQYFLLPAAVLLWWSAAPGQRLRLTVPLVIGFVLLFTPWQIRNLVTIGQLSDNSQMLHSMQHGMYPDFRYQDRPETTGFPYWYDPMNETFARDPTLVLTEIKRRFREDTARHLKWYLLGKPVTLLSWNILAGMGDIFVYPVLRSPFLTSPPYIGLLTVMKQLHWPLTVLALCATLLVWLPFFARRLPADSRLPLQLLSVLILYIIALHMVAAPFPRYGIPLRPVVYGLAMFLCARIAVPVLALRNRRSPVTDHG